MEQKTGIRRRLSQIQLKVEEWLHRGKTHGRYNKEPTRMREDTIGRKIATKGFRQIAGDDWARDRMYGIPTCQ